MFTETKTTSKGVIMTGKLGTVENVFAGFGGQGILFIGKVMSYAALNRGVSTSFIPSYGPEMRGGTANCKVVVAEGEVGSPIVEMADVVIAMNRPSLEKFEDSVKIGGKIIVNCSLIEGKVKKQGVNAYYIPCNEITAEVGSERGVSLVALGGLMATQDFFTLDDMLEAVAEVTGSKGLAYLETNKKAFSAGYDYVKSGKAI